MSIEQIEIMPAADVPGTSPQPEESETAKRPQPQAPATTKAVVVGLGNIGSHLVGHLARMASAVQLVLIDSDSYEAGNLAGQDMTRGDAGRAKAAVQARRVRHIAAQANVVAYQAAVEQMPLGVLRADVIFSCVDNRAARRYLAEAAWRLDVPLIDGAVDGTGLLGRVGVYVPGPHTACLLCTWNEADYQSQEQTYPCGGSNSPPGTRAPAELGAVVAGLMAVEARKLLESSATANGRPEPAARYLLFDLRHEAFELTTVTRNPQCRFDHRTWKIHSLHEPPSRVTVSELLRRAAPEALQTSTRSKHSAAISLPIPGQGFARQVVCPQCGYTRPIGLRLEERIARRWRICAQCQAQMQVDRFAVLEPLEGPELRAEIKARTRLSQLGFVAGDVVAVAVGGVVQHFELGAGRCAAAAAGRQNLIELRRAK